MEKYMKTHCPKYNQKEKRFIPEVTKHDLENNHTVTCVPLVIAPKIIVTKALGEIENTKKIESVPKTVSFPLKGSNWENDKRSLLYTWCKANLSPETRAKYLKSYLEQGQVPLEATSILPANSARQDVFEFFPRLPGELRNIIWKYAIDARPMDCLVRQGWEYKIDGMKCGRRLEHVNHGNPFLYANRESRSFALPRHELTFGTIFHRPQILFDYEHDRLFLITENHMDLCFMVEKMFVRNDRRRIKQLMIPLRDYLQDKEDTCRAITSFSYLEIVWFVVGDGKDEEGWSSDSNLAKRIRGDLKALWLWRFRRQKPELIPRTPTVYLNIIPAEVAHGFKIDGCLWAR